MNQNEREAPGDEAENLSEQEAAAAAAAGGAAAGEAPEKPEGEGGEKPPKLTPEEEATRKHNREQAERRLEKKRLRDLEIENARLKGFQEGVQKAGGKTEHEDTAGAEAALEAEYAKQSPEPTEDQFKTFAEYNRAHTRWTVGLDRHIQDQRAGAKKQQEAWGGDAARVQDILKAGSKHEDFEEAVYNLRDAGGLTDIMRISLLEADNPADIVHHLGTNPEEFARISKLSVSRQAAEIAKLDEKFAAPPQKRNPPPPPPPALPGKGNPRSGTPPTDTKELAAWLAEK